MLVDLFLPQAIGRHALVKLFASILKHEGDKYFLVTPVEKWGIKVVSGRTGARSRYDVARRSNFRRSGSVSRTA